jgi:hypothetical protein
LANALGAAFESVAAELRLIDPRDFIAFVLDEKFANIQEGTSKNIGLRYDDRRSWSRHGQIVRSSASD